MRVIRTRSFFIRIDACGAAGREVDILATIKAAACDVRQDGEAMPWYVIWTTPRKEELMLNRIRAEVPEELYGDVWIPMRVERRKYRGQYESSKHVLFARYIFIETDSPDRVHECIKKRPEYIRILGDERGSYLPVTEFEKRIIKRLTGDYEDVGVKPKRGRERNLELSFGILNGKKLTVIDGPLKGFEDFVTHIDRHKMKATVEMELFGEKRKFSAGLIIEEKDGVRVGEKILAT